MSVRRRQFIKNLGISVGSLSLLDIYTKIEMSIDKRPGRSDYTIPENLHYLNHASIGTCPIPIQDAFITYIRKCEENPARYIWGAEWDEARTLVRKQLAAFLNCMAEELAITHNTTEGFNQIAQGLDLAKGDEVLFSNLNHSGASICFHHYADIRGYTVKQIEAPLDEIMQWDADEITTFYTESISPSTKLLVLPHIDNLIGYNHPINLIASKARAKGVKYIAIDAAQSIGMIPVDLQSLDIDFYSGSPHKWLQSPKGLGLFYIRKSVQTDCNPLWVTWGQKRWKGTAQVYEDYGTRDLPTVLALGHALTYHKKTDWNTRTNHFKTLRQRAQGHCDQKISWYAPDIWDNGSSLFSVKIKGVDKSWEKNLVDSGYIVRAFDGFIRISPNTMNTIEEIDLLFETLRKIS